MVLTASWHTAPPERASRAKAFAAARRHSRAVRVLRVLLPLAGAASIAGFVVVAKLAFPTGLDLGAANLSVTRSSIVMDRPNLTGFDKRNREYSLTAARAIQAFATPGNVRLEDLQAKIADAGGKLSLITAEAADYDHLKRTLKLFGPITVDSAEGYRLKMVDADADIGAGTLHTETPVTIGYGQSVVSADRLEVSDGGKVILLEGHVRTTVMPPKDDKGGRAESAATVPGTDAATAAPGGQE